MDEEEEAHARDVKKKMAAIVEEYFAAGDVASTACDLLALVEPRFHFYFVKKLVSTAMDRHDKEKEMAAALLSALYAAPIQPSDLYLGFTELVRSCDDLYVDIPDAVDVLALFLARAVVDDMLPPAFLTKEISTVEAESKGAEAMKRAQKSYLSAPLHSEMVLGRWGGSGGLTADNAKKKIRELLSEYLLSGDLQEAFRCVKNLKLPFFHHEIVKQALVIAMERKEAAELVLRLLRSSCNQGLINASQITKGFNRTIDGVQDLTLDIPNAKQLLDGLISRAASEGWVSWSSLVFLPNPAEDENETQMKSFKKRAEGIIQEYFLTGDILEVIGNLETEIAAGAVFVKKLISMAMDRRSREKEMASMLLPALPFSAEELLSGFQLLLASAEDAALDVPTAADDLAMFLARAVADEALAPLHLQQLGGGSAAASAVLKMANALLSAPLAGERILRCWGGGSSSSRIGWEIEDVKEKMNRLLEEYAAGGELTEACRCAKELGMPFFHHELVKKALVAVMASKGSPRLWELLERGFDMGLISKDQMEKGFRRVEDCLEDLALDLPDAGEQLRFYMEMGRCRGWLGDDNGGPLFC
ncbi:MA3 DOMAIN-CONTAINING TRANSLATION REGULATORY FACTOR 2-like [Wolffia australiana]